MLLRGPDRAAHEHHPAARAWDRALDQQQAALGVDGLHGERLNGGPHPAHPARHPHALEHVPRGRARADGAGRPVLALGAVRGAQALEAVPLHDAREALALALACHVHVLAAGEDLGGDLLADRVLRRVVGAQLGNVPARGQAGLLEQPADRLGHLARVDLAKAELHGRVPVPVRSAHAGYHARPSLHDRDRHDLPGLVEDLGHAELGAQDPFDLLSHCRYVPQSLISMSTPAERSSRISESTVFGVGSMMSISRLCVRISKCSRESLYLCGERMTQYTFFSVGSGTGPATRAPVRVTVSTIFRAELSMTSWSYALSRMRIFCPAMFGPRGPGRRMRRLLNNLRDPAGADGAAAFADREPEAFLHGDRLDQVDVHIGPVARHDHLGALWEVHHAGHVGGPEVELRTVVVEERRVPPASSLDRM